MMTDNITVTITTPSDREAVVTREFNAASRARLRGGDESRSDQALVWRVRIARLM